MSSKANAWLPWASDFEAGAFWRGGVGMLMQGTLVFWPVAYRMARKAAARRAMDERLRDVAAAYAVRRPSLPKAAAAAEDAPAMREAA